MGSGRARRSAVVIAAAILVSALVASLVISRSPTSREPFGRSWASPLPATTPISPQSSSLVSALVDQYRTYYGAVGVNQLPIYRVAGDQALVMVTVRSGCNNFLPGTGRRIPIPSTATTSGTGDSPLIIYQASTNTEWELWRAWKSSTGSWQACWGGKLTDVSGSDGVFPAPYGLSASEISYLATTVTDSDIRAGRIDHTMAIDVVRCTAPAVPPAIHTDCGSDPGEPAEGTILRLPRSVPMPAGLTEFGRLVFQALKTYGLVVTDRAGAVVLQAQGAGDPGAGGLVRRSWGGKPEYAALDGIPWNKLQVLEPTGALAHR
jgi:hypothetical protein